MLMNASWTVLLWDEKVWGMWLQEELWFSFWKFLLLWNTSAIIVCLLNMNESWVRHQMRECILFQKVILKKIYISSCSVYSRKLEDFDPDLQQGNTQKKIVELGNYNV